ncbi:hypothetical protein B0H16DRAFT_1476223 [Mycena metata]|uniref:Uncharacterized protein n=1 Tax=Mycena metata TaxID=1033252 RepID=A0AAD7HBX7_9AGAR|nr:hypothetical protein B0H16DRAFT_1476223 [Mycena metata]
MPHDFISVDNQHSAKIAEITPVTLATIAFTSPSSALTTGKDPMAQTQLDSFTGGKNSLQWAVPKINPWVRYWQIWCAWTARWRRSYVGGQWIHREWNIEAHTVNNCMMDVARRIADTIAFIEWSYVWESQTKGWKTGTFEAMFADLPKNHATFADFDTARCCALIVALHQDAYKTWNGRMTKVFDPLFHPPNLHLSNRETLGLVRAVDEGVTLFLRQLIKRRPSTPAQARVTKKREEVAAQALPDEEEEQRDNDEEEEEEDRGRL